jgi:hypothetical protein
MAETPTVRAEYVPGQVAGLYATQPRGIILHGSRSGKKQDPLKEYAGTVNWAVKNPEGLGWTATIGPGVYCVHMTCKQWGWNAREHSRDFLAVEFAQPTIADPITDAMVAAFAEWYRVEVRRAWPLLTPRVLVLPMHSELPAGKRDGKSDAFMPDSPQAKDLRARIYAALEEPMPEEPYTVGAGVLAAMTRAKETPTSHEVYYKAKDTDDEMSLTSGSQGGLFVYFPPSDSVYRIQKV